MTAAQSKAVGHNTNPKDSNVPQPAMQWAAGSPTLRLAAGLRGAEDATLTG
jgi:hypothetical protein